MEGIPNNNGIIAENKASEENSYDAVKGVIMRQAPEIIGSTVDKLLRDNEMLGRTDIPEGAFILEVLKYIAPENPKMWQDEELIDSTREIVQERLAKKITTASGTEEYVQSEEDAADMIKRIEQNPPKKSPNLFGSKKMRNGSWGHEKSLGVKEDD